MRIRIGLAISSNRSTACALGVEIKTEHYPCCMRVTVQAMALRVSIHNQLHAMVRS